MAAVIKKTFRSYPLVANCVTYGSMLVGTECFQQFYNKRIRNKTNPPEPFDTGAMWRYAVVGTTVNPTILYFWYKWLDKKYLGTTMKVVFKKVLLDQFGITPLIYVAFYTSLSILERKENVFEELSAKFGPTFITSCFFWLPAQAINFTFVPNAGRIVYISFCSFLWMNILCYIKRKEF